MTTKKYGAVEFTPHSRKKMAELSRKFAAEFEPAGQIKTSPTPQTPEEWEHAKATMPMMAEAVANLLRHETAGAWDSVEEFIADRDARRQKRRAAR